MDAITYLSARANLAGTMDRVCEDHEPIITRNGQQEVVMLCLGDYNAMDETAYLLRSPGNAKRPISFRRSPEGRGLHGFPPRTAGSRVMRSNCMQIPIGSNGCIA